MVKKLLYLSLVLFAIKICGQDKAKNIFKQQTDSILKRYKEDNKLDSIAILSHDVSIKYYKKGDFNKAVFYAKKEVDLGNKVLNNSKYKKSIYNLGRFYYLNKKYSKSIENLRKVVDSFEVNAMTYRAYCAIGRGYNKLGDFYQAINYFKKGLSKKDLFTTRDLLDNYNNLAIIYQNIGTKKSLNKEFKLLKKIDSLLKQTNSGYSRIQLLNSAYGNYYSKKLTFDYTKSRKYYLKLLDNAIQYNDSVNINTASINLGSLYNRQKKDSALFFLKKGLKHVTESDDYLYLYLNLSDYYFNNNEYKKSLSYNHKVLLQSTLSKIDSSYNFVPEIKSLINTTNKSFIINSLKGKAKIFLKWHTVSNNSKHVELALENIILADKLMTISRQNSFESKSKLVWQTEASKLYMLAVKACYKLNKPEQAFYFMEKNKALLLLDNIYENEIKNKVSLPSSVLQKELDLKRAIYTVENELDKNKQLKEKYHSLKIEYNNFIESLKLKYPEYYNSKELIDIETIKFIKNSINKKTTVLEYILNKEEGFLLLITKNNTQLFKLNEVENLNATINGYLKLISEPLSEIEKIKKHKKIANQLYNILFPFNNKNLLKEKLLIVPDYTLQNLPFESLKNQNKYLIEHYEVSYAYSLSFLNKNKNIKRKAKRSVIAFAPKSFDYDNLQVLSRSENEVKTINKILNGEVLLATLASKNNFLSKIKEYKIIHLSTHANANDSIAPWIAFKNKKLYLNELYTTKNEAELVVLNACNSSLGKINAGEGVFSLARGFFYSGANSVISSLWNVNDKSNAEITTSFYHYLKKGKTKSAALRQAKLDYLKTHTLSDLSPYYWSSLILIGNDSPVFFCNNILTYSVLSLLLISSLFLFYKKKQREG